MSDLDLRALSAKADGKMPQTPGYYWAKWQIAATNTHEGDELTPAANWEIVQVNANVVSWREETDEENPERLSVSVPGVRETQWRDCFVWGAFVAPLKAAAEDKRPVVQTASTLPEPDYTREDYGRLHAQLVEVTAERDAYRDALISIRDAWTARARLSDEDGVQALKDIAREALR